MFSPIPLHFACWCLCAAGGACSRALQDLAEQCGELQEGDSRPARQVPEVQHFHRQTWTDHHQAEGGEKGKHSSWCILWELPGQTQLVMYTLGAARANAARDVYVGSCQGKRSSWWIRWELPGHTQLVMYTFWAADTTEVSLTNFIMGHNSLGLHICHV